MPYSIALIQIEVSIGELCLDADEREVTNVQLKEYN